MTHSLLSVTNPNQNSSSKIQCFVTSNSWLHPSSTAYIKYPSKPCISFSSSSPSSTSIVNEDTSPSQETVKVQSESSVVGGDKLPFSGCKACGREEIERGCNGEGRIQGGIATVPGFGWWPIKAYRPCPGFLASGGRYRRTGQSMDEVAFGKGERTNSSSTSTGAITEFESSKKKEDQRRFKR